MWPASHSLVSSYHGNLWDHKPLNDFKADRVHTAKYLFLDDVALKKTFHTQLLYG